MDMITNKESTTYLNGLGNHFQSEAIPNTLLQGRNSPQKVPHGLYADNSAAVHLPCRDQ